jgi:hypothetical protein
MSEVLARLYGKAEGSGAGCMALSLPGKLWYFCSCPIATHTPQAPRAQKDLNLAFRHCPHSSMLELSNQNPLSYKTAQHIRLI